MSVLPVGIGSSGGYEISRSVRLRSSASAYLSKTLATPTNNKIWTWSSWVKKGTLTSDMYLVAANGTTAYEFIKLSNSSSDNFEYAYWNGSAYVYQIRSTLVLRDPSAWYHIVMQVDTTQATAANRVRMYVNNVEVTSFSISSYPSQNTNTQINSAIATRIGGGFASAYFDGYLTEINFIDGQALTPSSFGETDSITGVWKPKKYTGTYGTNGFYLNFSDNSAATAAAIGKDYSGNGNNWTPNNISVTSGVTYDSMLDTPTPYADGGNGRGNYCVINPIDKNLATITNGNLRMTGAASTYQANGSMAFPASGKWYFEATVSANSNASNGLFVGIASPTRVVGSALSAAGTYGLYGSAASAIYSNGSNVASGLPVLNSTYTYQLAVDVDNGKAWVGYHNGTTQYWYNSTGGTTGDPAAGTNPTFTVALAGFFPLFQADSASGYFWYANFGQRPFAQSAPTGFKALNTQNLPEGTIKKGSQYFDTTLWSGDGTSGRVITTNVETVDFAWVKKRNGIDDHRLANSVLGGNKHLKSNATDAESTGTTVIQAFSGSTFTVGSDNSVNASGGTYAGWTWKESVSAGFDIVTYTGNGANRTIAHSLGAVPKMMIVKSRSIAENWPVYHASMNASPASGRLILDGTAAFTASSTTWQSTAPTDLVFSVGTATAVNTNGATYVAYLFSEVAGYSKFGSYIGNGAADGPFVYLGFRPRFLMIKNITNSQPWIMIDTSRNTYNQAGDYLQSNSSGIENALSAVSTSTADDILSNGFKLRNNASSSGYTNASANTYIYAAFAENPFKHSLAR